MPRQNSRSLWAEKVTDLQSRPPVLAGESRKVRRRVASEAAPLSLARFAPRAAYVGHVLGVDPSLRGTGLAVVECSTSGDGSPVLRASRTLRLGRELSMPECLGEIYKAIADYIEDWPIRHVALEQTIYVQNFQTAQILGAARGAAIAAAAVLGKPVFEYPPLRIKQAVVGFGRASKPQVAGMTRQILSLPASLPFDESDAAAAALCHAHTWRG